MDTSKPLISGLERSTSVRFRTMGGRSVPAGHALVAGQVAEIIVTLDGRPGRRGSGYRVGRTAVLTAAHVVEDAVAVRVRFDADLPGEWTAEVISCWADQRCDLAVLTIAPRESEPAVAVARFGRIGAERAAVLAARAVGFPRFKLKTDDGAHLDADPSRYRDSHQADGSVAVLSNRREGTLEITLPPPERDPDLEGSPWEGMSGAAVWVGERIVGVIAKHHRSDGLGRLAAARLDLATERLDSGQRAELQRLLGLPDVLPDVIPPSVGEWVRTAYQVQVRDDIASDQLLDRDAELDDLVGFCAGDEPYAWWQAGPWAGKSTLMSWFVLHPPAGVDVVSFFVTARLAGQSDSDACTAALIEQLAALLGESPAGLLTAGARRGILLRLLDEAASRAREAGRRLLLVIDGLDEDSGATTGPSIAALLPRRPPPEVRVLVASRSHPPVPDDVLGDHPLRTITPRRLVVFEHARDVERRAKHELTQLLTGSQLQRDVLGLITAAGGGLTLGDLEELTEHPPFEIEHLLGGVFGRSVGSPIGTPSAGYPDERVYLFSHETLRLVARQQFGKSLAAYRDRLHIWAETYRHRGWPADTPRYLLRSYPRMLADNEDLSRLVACATDHARHDRMRDLTGGDALAFTEISTAQQRLLAQSDPDLTSLARLAVERDHLTDRNSNIPVNLPAVWAILGQPARTEALVDSILDPDRRVEALARVAAVVATTGDHNRAETLASGILDAFWQAKAYAQIAEAVATTGDHDRAEVLCTQITDPSLRAEGLVQVAAAIAAGGDHDRAQALAGRITDPNRRATVLARVAEAVAASGEHDRAEALTAQITCQARRAETLARLVELVAASGDHDRATRLTTLAETLTTHIAHSGRRAVVLARIAEAVATTRDQDQVTRIVTEAETTITRIANPDVRMRALARVAEALASSGDHDKAEALIAQIAFPYWRVRMIAHVVKAVANNGDHDRAEALIAQIGDPYQRAEILTQLIEAMARNRNHNRTTRLATEAEGHAVQITDLSRRAAMLTRIAEAVATTGEHDQACRLASEAESLTAQITHPRRRAWALVKVADVVTISGDHDRAARLATEAEALTAQIADPYQREKMLAVLAEVVALNGDHDRAEALTAQLVDPHLRAETLARLVELVAASGDHDRATRLTIQAETLTAQTTHPGERAYALARVAAALAAIGDHNRAARLATESEALTSQTTDPGTRTEALTRLVEVVAVCGNHHRAARLATEAAALASQITDPYEGIVALLEVAKAVATSGDHSQAEV
ncbi:MAG: trypsin-like peptidase domain-containing protein, partial [Pseudonocardiaceae bacterium]